jgi:hypothetical protein
MRSETTPAKIEAFLKALGQRVSGNGKVYLTGGASALLIGWRQMTIDIDLKADPEPQNFFEAIAELKNELDINVELASPDQFIPELPGWRDRSIFILREKQIDFYHYDFYSQALSKLERAHTRDQKDVIEMEKKGLIEKGKLWDFFQQIESRLIRFPAIHSSVFREKVQKYCLDEKLS